MLYRPFLTTITLAALVGLTGLTACRKDEPERAEDVAAVQPSTPEKEAGPPSVTASLDAVPGENAPAQPSEQGSLRRPRVNITPDADAAIRELLARWEEVQSASVSFATDFERLAGLGERQKSEGTRDCLKKDGKMLIRSSYTNAVALEKEGKEWIVTGQIALKVFDGEFLYTVDERHEGKTATKSLLKRGQFQYIGGRRLLSQILGLDSFSLLPDETIDDQSVYVFEGKAGDGTVTTRHYFDKQTGMLLKMATEDSIAQTRYTFALSDIKVNVEFDDDHFTFTPPEGMEVQDLTRRGAVKVPLPAQP